MVRIRKRRRKNNRTERILMLVFVLLVSTFAFLYSLYFIVSPRINETRVQDDSATHKEFIEKLVPHAQQLHVQHGVLPSIILGQAILESDWGTSKLASEYHNLFGIKASEGQEKVTLETQEYVNEEWVTIQGDFRVYGSWEESMDDHTQLFINGVTWNPEKYTGVLQATDYKQAAQALQDAGYATDPGYAKKIISVIEENKLSQYDQE